jgi:hypothetical protein
MLTFEDALSLLTASVSIQVQAYVLVLGVLGLVIVGVLVGRLTKARPKANPNQAVPLPPPLEKPASPSKSPETQYDQVSGILLRFRHVCRRIEPLVSTDAVLAGIQSFNKVEHTFRSMGNERAGDITVAAAIEMLSRHLAAVPDALQAIGRAEDTSDERVLEVTGLLDELFRLDQKLPYDSDKAKAIVDKRLKRKPAPPPTSAPAVAAPSDSTPAPPPAPVPTVEAPSSSTPVAIVEVEVPPDPTPAPNNGDGNAPSGSRVVEIGSLDGQQLTTAGSIG